MIAVSGRFQPNLITDFSPWKYIPCLENVLEALNNLLSTDSITKEYFHLTKKKKIDKKKIYVNA